MDTISVWSAMTPLEELAAVKADSTLMATASSLRACNLGVPGPALVRVMDESGDTVGVVGMVDVIRGLEPKYQKDGFYEDMREKALPKGILELFITNYGSDHISIRNLVERARSCTVQEILRKPFPDETISREASIGMAMDTLVLRRREYLLVLEGERVLGVVDSFLILDAALAKAGDTERESRLSVRPD
ncbi:MAG: hypothetical protein HY795_10085 [Desulfovibrio sp.]|nr:hypothetical protein [Desulfovibrio sp.]MBI4959651.1 hypothetical protein [Desulfovibrio sp.]